MQRYAIPSIAVLCWLGCGEPAPPPPAPPTTGAEAEPAEPEAPPDEPSAIEVLGITPPEQPWEEMDAAEREFYMVGHVLPITTEIFRDFDQHAFAEFECESCHGEEAEAHDFAMPPPDLPVVPEPGTEAYGIMENDQPRMVHFMEAQVMPTTATLLGFELRDAETGEGFGCNDCHPTP